MRKTLMASFVIFLAALGMGIGCSSSNNGSFGGGGSGIIDLAVGDKEMNHSPNVGGQILIWYNVMSKLGAGNVGDVGTNAPAADVTISTSEVHWPARMVFANGALFVSNSGEDVSGTNIGNVSIYRDYLNLANNAMADVFLDATGSNISTAKEIQVYNNDLFLADWGTSSTSSTTKIFRGVDTLVSHQAPDVTLDNATALVFDSRGLFVGPHASATTSDLYVGNWDQTSAAACVIIFRDQASLTGNVAPDVVMHNNTSFLDLGATQSSGGCRDVIVNNDILYVGYGYSDSVFIFNGAASLTDDALPDAVLAGFNTGSKLNTITSMGFFGNALFVTNHNETDPVTGDCCTTVNTLPAINIFADAGSLTDGQAPDLTFAAADGITYADRVVFAGNTMFVTGGADNVNFAGNGPHSSVFIFTNPSSTSTSGGNNMFTIAGDDLTDSNFLMDYPTGLAAVSR